MTENTDRTAPGDGTIGLLGDILLGFTRLVQGELALAKAEAARTVREAAGGVAKIAIGFVLGIVALNVLAGAAVAGLISAGLSPVWANLAVGAVLVLLAAACVQFGRSALKPSNLAPKRSFESLRKDAATLKDMVTPGATADIRP